MGKGKAIAGLVLGIVALVAGWLPVPFLAFAALPMAIVGLVLSVLAGKQNKSGLQKAALVVSIIAVVLSAISFVTCGLCAVCVAAAA